MAKKLYYFTKWCNHIPYGFCLFNEVKLNKIVSNGTHVDLMVIHLSCSSLRVSVKRVSPALAFAIIPALDTRESVNVDLPWSTWAMTDMLRIFRFLSIIPLISSTVKFTCINQKTACHIVTRYDQFVSFEIYSRTFYVFHYSGFHPFCKIIKPICIFLTHTTLRHFTSL